MTLTSIRKELNKAKDGAYAVPLFDVFDVPGVEGVMESLEEKRAPTIFAIYSQLIDNPNAEAFITYIRTRANNSSVPISIMLDHGSSFEQCMKALSLGVSDVMYDGSSLPLEENIGNTCLVVKAAHAMGAAVEAELGHVGSGSDYDSSQRVGFTDPALVERFVKETGVDFLAIAFGNAHGLYKAEPRLDLDLVREVRRRVDIPIAMHGGTGLSDEQFRGAIEAGIAKINVATIMVNTAGKYMVEEAKSKDPNIFSFARVYQQAYRECSAHLYDVFGTSGKGQ